MNISEEEHLMYQVMRAIFDSGIPIDFKGSMVLKACLIDGGYSEEIRHTVDIDANWYSDVPPSAGQMVDSLQSALRKSGIDLDVSIYRMYGEGRSAGFELTLPGSGEALFSMDIDVNRPAVPSRIYEVDGIRFRGVSPAQILADKLSVLSSDKVFRRIKDMVDLYYISRVFDFNKAKLAEALSNNGRTLDSFQGFLKRKSDLKHAYEKFRFSGEVDKPSFDEVYHTVKSYIAELLPKERDRGLER